MALRYKTQKLLGPKRPHRSFFESFIRTLITCAALAVVLSSVSICDGHWLLKEDRLFGLWFFCTISNHSGPHCLRDLSFSGWRRNSERPLHKPGGLLKEALEIEDYVYSYNLLQ
ncbi:hypothetical protein STEG23_023155 [Scotinomys teguina]